ncbi:MAG: bacteriorhodopsin [Halobacteriales archaeon]|nr:bacteriorhodopsin [Halobacteriales archaeon]
MIEALGADPSTAVLWLGALAMFVGTFVYLWLGRNVAVYEQEFFVMAISITMIAATAYLAMAMGMGRIAVNGEEVVVARYIDWLLTTPIILVLLGVLANADRSLIATLIGVDVYMISVGLLGAVANSLFVSLVWWSLGVVAFLVLLYLLLGVLSDAAEEMPDDVSGMFVTLRNLTVVIWSFYPVVWILGGHGFGVLPVLVEDGGWLLLDVLFEGRLRIHTPE